MSFGVSFQGFAAERLADVLDQLTELLQNGMGSDIDLSNDGPIGQLRGILADLLTTLWELLDESWMALDPATAAGSPLDRLMQSFDLHRLGAEPTVVGVRLLGDPFTVVPAGFELRTADAGNSFLLKDDIVLDPVGGGFAEFDSATNGPLPCLAGTLNVIPTPLVGLHSASNPLDGIPGLDPETDAAFRARRRGAFATTLASTFSGVLTAMLRVPDVLEAVVIENNKAEVDGDGRPPNSLEVCVRGGADADIRTALWRSRPSGIALVGNIGGTVLDARGDAHSVPFSRPVDVSIYAKVALRVNPLFPANGITQVQAAVLTYGNGLLIGQKVAPFGFEAACAAIPGIDEMDVFLGTLPNPTGISPVIVTRLQRARLDSTRLQVVQL